MSCPMKKKEPIPFWLQITLIILCGVILSAVVLLILRGRNAADQQKPEPTPDNAVYTVTFAWQDGTVIDTCTAHGGKGVIPPELETDAIFRGWSGAVNNVRSDIEVHPMLYHGDADENLFCFDTLYVLEGTDFTIDLNLTGRVGLSHAELKISYDPQVMDYFAADPAVCCTVTEEAPGQLLLVLHSETPIREPLRLAGLTFAAKPEDVYSTQISLSCSGAYYLQGKEEIPATVSTLNNQIYYLQEVE